MANLGYVGLGAMGGNMADLLMAKGHTVTGYNRTQIEGALADGERHEMGRFAARGGRGVRHHFRW